MSNTIKRGTVSHGGLRWLTYPKLTDLPWVLVSASISSSDNLGSDAPLEAALTVSCDRGGGGGGRGDWLGGRHAAQAQANMGEQQGDD